MSAITYTPDEVERHATRARSEEIKLGRTANGFIYRATSGETKTFDYTVKVVPGTTVMGAECNCYAGQTGKQCKHGAAAIAAVELRSVKEAAAILARHGARKRAAKRAA